MLANGGADEASIVAPWRAHLRKTNSCLNLNEWGHPVRNPPSRSWYQEWKAFICTSWMLTDVQLSLVYLCKDINLHANNCSNLFIIPSFCFLGGLRDKICCFYSSVYILNITLLTIVWCIGDLNRNFTIFAFISALTGLFSSIVCLRPPNYLLSAYTKIDSLRS